MAKVEHIELEPGVQGFLHLKKANEEQELALLEEDLRSEHRNCRSCFRIGTAFEQIVREAENIKASVIVMSSHSYRLLDRIVHGSAADWQLFDSIAVRLLESSP
jgi:nucleotide-binding universal stress UspA family protein